MADEVIAVMGATGAGKSSFIKMVTEDEGVVVGHGLTSETQAIIPYPWHFAGRNMVLVDTPGFNDTYRSDGDILQNLVEWLANTYKNGTKLSGIIYLHRITDVRMQGSAMRNLRVFRELCGPGFFPHVTLCASFWSTSPYKQKEQEQRINELTGEGGYWSSMIAAGSTVFKEPLTRHSAIQMIFKLPRNGEQTMQIQREVVEEQKPIQESSAVAMLMSLQLERQEKEHQEKMAELKLHFENTMRARERTHSENLDSMRQAFETKLAEAEAMNAKVRAEIDGLDQPPPVYSIPPPPTPTLPVPPSPHDGQAQVRRKSVPPPLQRASTIPVDPVSIDAEFALRRWLRYKEFMQYTTANIRLLEQGKTIGKMKCNVSKWKGCYTMVCTHCLQNIGSGFCYTCVACSADEQVFLLCSACYTNPFIHCNDGYHVKTDMVKDIVNITASQCPRVRVPPQRETLLCKKCISDVGKVYLHCCACKENFDMCLRCALQGKSCPGHIWGRHKLEICGRYVDL